MICGINTTHDICKFFQISLTQQLVKLCIAISKYHLCYLCQISPQIMLLPILINYNNIFVVLSNFRSSSVADQAMDIIITLSKPKYQEIERGRRIWACFKVNPFLLFGKRIVLTCYTNLFSFFACRSGCC